MGTAVPCLIQARIKTSSPARGSEAIGPWLAVTTADRQGYLPTHCLQIKSAATAGGLPASASSTRFLRRLLRGSTVSRHFGEPTLAHDNPPCAFSWDCLGIGRLVTIRARRAGSPRLRSRYAAKRMDEFNAAMSAACPRRRPVGSKPSAAGGFERSWLAPIRSRPRFLSRPRTCWLACACLAWRRTDLGRHRPAGLPSHKLERPVPRGGFVPSIIR